MLSEKTVDMYINEHKKIYKKRLMLLVGKVYDLIEKGEENISIKLTDAGGGYYVKIKDYQSITNDSFSTEYTFDEKALKRLSEWYRFNEKELIQELNKRIAYIDNHLAMVVGLSKTHKHKKGETK